MLIGDIVKKFSSKNIVLDNLVVWYDGEDFKNNPQTTTLIDKSGNNTNASVLNFSYNSTSGSDGTGGIVFDGANDYMQATRTVSDDFTLECEFSTISNKSSSLNWYQGMGLIDSDFTNIANDFGLAFGASKVTCGVRTLTIRSANSYDDGQVHTASMRRVKSTGVIDLFVDGVKVSTGTGVTDTLNAQSVIQIGKCVTSAASTSYFAGTIRKIRIYSKALTDGEILQNYKAS